MAKCLVRYTCALHDACSYCRPHVPAHPHCAHSVHTSPSQRRAADNRQRAVVLSSVRASASCPSQCLFSGVGHSRSAVATSVIVLAVCFTRASVSAITGYQPYCRPHMRLFHRLGGHEGELVRKPSRVRTTSGAFASSPFPRVMTSVSGRRNCAAMVAWTAMSFATVPTLGVRRLPRCVCSADL